MSTTTPTASPEVAEPTDSSPAAIAGATTAPRGAGSDDGGADVAASAETPARRRLEVLIVVLLGLVSVTTAWASFQAALYDSAMSAAYAQASTAATEAESLYQEGLQTLRQDEYVWNRLVELTMDQQSSDPEIVSLAELKFSNLHSSSVSTELQAAIEWSNAQSDADPEASVSPFDSDEYLSVLFAPYNEMRATSTEHTVEGDEFNALSDRLTLNTVLMAVALFLLGVAAILQRRSMVVSLTVIASVIFVTALALTIVIPAMWV